MIAAKSGNGSQLHLYALYPVIKKAAKAVDIFTVTFNCRRGHASLFVAFSKVAEMNKVAYQSLFLFFSGSCSGGFCNHTLDEIA